MGGMTYKDIRRTILREKQFRATDLRFDASLLCRFLDRVVERMGWPEEAWDPSPVRPNLDGTVRHQSFGDGSPTWIALTFRVEAIVKAEIEIGIRRAEAEKTWEILGPGAVVLGVFVEEQLPSEELLQKTIERIQKRVLDAALAS